MSDNTDDEQLRDKIRAVQMVNHHLIRLQFKSALSWFIVWVELIKRHGRFS